MDFQLLLSKISDKLLKEDVVQLKFYLDEKIPSQDLKTAEDGKDLFGVMKKYGLLSPIKTDLLIEMLTAMHLQPCVDLIENFKEKNKEALSTAKDGPCNIKEDMVVEHFMETSKLIELEVKMTTTKFITLSGLLGSGKSQLALKHACKKRQSCKSGICWRISCQDMVILLNSLKKWQMALA